MTHDTEAEQAKAVIRRLFEQCINRAEWELAQELISPRFEGPYGNGVAGFLAIVQPLHQAFGQLHFTLDAVMAEGGTVSVRWTMTGIHQAFWAGVPATQRQITQQAAVFYRVEGGQVIGVQTYFDRMGMLEQLGAAIAPPRMGPAHAEAAQ